mgnify:CR=1 FL=1
MKRVWKAKEVIKGWEGKPIKIQMADDPFDENSDVEVGDMTVFGAMLVIANNFTCETLDDASKKKSLKQALKASVKSGLIELDAETFKWLKNASEKVCPRAWQDNANEVHDIITEGYRKENELSKLQPKKKDKTDEAPVSEEK